MHKRKASVTEGDDRYMLKLSVADEHVSLIDVKTFLFFIAPGQRNVDGSHRRLLRLVLFWRGRRRCLTAKPTEGYPKVVDCRQGLAKIRMLWCKEHKDLERFRPPERNTLRLVWLFVLPLESIDHRDVYRVVSCDLEESLPALI